MMTLQHIITIFFFFMLINNSCEKLIGVIQFIRHGARTPLDFFDAFKSDFQPFDKGELTEEGFTMAYDKGKFMRKEYSQFDTSSSEIKENFVKELDNNQNLIKVFTTPVQRTILTSYAYLKGFFPKFQPAYEKSEEMMNLDSLMHGRYFINIDKNFLNSNLAETSSNQNLQVQVFDSNHEFVYRPRCIVFKKSHKIKKNNQINLTDEEYKLLLDFESHYPTLFKEYCKFIKKRYPDMASNCSDSSFREEYFLDKIAGALHSIDYHKKQNVNPELKKLSYVSYIKLHYDALNDANAKLEGTNHMRYIKSFLTNVNNCNNTNINQTESSDINSEEANEAVINSVEKELHCRKYVLFSLHDDNLYAILRSLFNINDNINDLFKNFEDLPYEKIRNLLNFYWPPYISDFSFQLHEDEVTNEQYVRLLYNGKEMKDTPFFKKNSNDIVYTDSGIKLGDFLNYLDSRISKKVEYLNKCD